VGIYLTENPEIAAEIEAIIREKEMGKPAPVADKKSAGKATEE
jgi:recombination protein RecA